MKKSWIIVLAFVFLWSAVPAFSVPVPSELCLRVGPYSDSFRVILNSEGMIGSVEYFRVTGSYVWPAYAREGSRWVNGGGRNGGGGSLLKGSAHRQGKKLLHLGLTGTFDAYGPGSGGDTYQLGYDVRYHLKKKKGTMSYSYLSDEAPPAKAFTDSISGTDTLTAVDCSTLDEPPY